MFLFSVIVITLPRVKQRRIFSILLTFYIIIVVTFKKCGKLPSRKFGNHQTVHRPTDRPTDRPRVLRNHRHCNPKATQGFIWKEIAWPPGLLERKNNNKVVSFSTLFFMFTLTWITEKELERVIENKRNEFCRKKNMKIQSGGETKRNATGQKGENERQ